MTPLPYAVRHLYSLLRLMAVACCLLTAPASQAAGGTRAEYYDSVEVSLLTCSPHEEIYSLYGHTALRFHDLHQADGDIVLNWGTFNFNAPYFVARFVFGLTDYELGVADYEEFCDYYRQWGSMVTEQVLNLLPDEKVNLQRLLAENLQPENRIYRYNFFYDNCSTRPRDLIERAIEGRLQYQPRHDYEPTWRQMVREKSANHPWATFGNDMLLGLRADQKTTYQQQEFLPENLLYDFDHAQVLGRDGVLRPLVSERRMVVEPGVQMITSDFPLLPIECAVILLVLTLLVAVGEWKRRKTYRWIDMAWMLLFGLAGCVLFVMVFSQHPTTTINLQLLLINPIHLFFLPAVWRRRPTRYWPLLAAMICLFFIGAVFQRFAEGTHILALCLLIRWWINRRCSQQTH